MSKVRPRLLLADDHPMVLDGLRKLLEPDFEVVAAVTDGRELRRGCGPTSSSSTSRCRSSTAVTTVRTHLNKVYDKLGSDSRVELALLAAQPGGAVM